MQKRGNAFSVSIVGIPFGLERLVPPSFACCIRYMYPAETVVLHRFLVMLHVNGTEFLCTFIAKVYL